MLYLDGTLYFPAKILRILILSSNTLSTYKNRKIWNYNFKMDGQPLILNPKIVNCNFNMDG